ncbi:MAG: hypothetical protein CMP10_06550 [Zetaproteobacteria bacterium]|nr:hypothetical protein [Pseudobdellovibrionaceae bacterium]
MKSSLQQSIKPYVPSTKVDFSDAKINDPTKVQDTDDSTSRSSFKDVLMNSNEEIRQKREAEKIGDYSQIDSEEEFLEKLSEENKPKRVPKKTLDKDDFLKLFVTQLQHQDPLNPDDGAEMASKLAQFNGLEQMMNMNSTMDQLVAGQGSARSIEMVNYVGKELVINGGRVKKSGDEMTESKFNVPIDSIKTSLEIRDSQGFVITSKDLGTLKRGNHAFEWDGKKTDGSQAPDGVYSYNLVAKTINGENIDVDITSNAKVIGVDVGDQTGELYTDFGKVNFEDIKTIGAEGFHNQVKKQETSPEKSAKNIELKDPKTAPAINPDLSKIPIKENNNKSATDSVVERLKQLQTEPNRNDIKAKKQAPKEMKSDLQDGNNIGNRTNKVTDDQIDIGKLSMNSLLPKSEPSNLKN